MKMLTDLNESLPVFLYKWVGTWLAFFVFVISMNLGEGKLILKE